MKGKCGASSKKRNANEDREIVLIEQLEGKTMLGDVIWAKLSGGSWWPAMVVDENAVSRSSRPVNKSKQDVLVRLYGSYEYLYVDPGKCRSEFEIALKLNDGCYREIFRKALEQDLPRSKAGRSKGQQSQSRGASNGRVDDSRDKKLNQNQANQERDASNHKSAHSGKAASGRSSKAKAELTDRNSKGNVSGKEATPQKCARNFNLVGDSLRKQMHTVAPQSKTKNGNLTSEDVDEVNGKATKQDAVKRKPNSASTSGTTLFERSQELSARRLKVMQTLGLIAPSGSPFNKNGHICPSV